MSTAVKKIAPRKIEGLKELKERLAKSENFVLTTYSGLNVVRPLSYQTSIWPSSHFNDVLPAKPG